MLYTHDPIMKSSESFLLEYFAARNGEIKREEEGRKPFRKAFFSDHCLWESRLKALELSESEHVVLLEETDTEAIAITTRYGSLPKLRYTLKRGDHSGWLIHKIQPACGVCSGVEGKKDCVICLGNGWLSLP